MLEYTNTQIKELIREYVHSKRDREILFRRLVDGRTYEQLAEEFSLSVAQIKRVLNREQERLFRHIR